MSNHVARWSKRIAIGVATVFAVALLVGSTYEQVMRHTARRDYPAPGRLVDIGGGRRIQIDCRGAGSPTVVLEAGLDNLGSLSWAAVHDSIAATTRVCAYSRAGIMWSDPSDASFTLTSVARDLHDALTAAGEKAPYVAVGHSIGGPYIMSFAHAYPSEVKGLVFVDASHPDQFARFREIAGKSLTPSAVPATIGAALAWTGILRVLSLDATLASWPAETRRVAPAFFSTSLHALAREAESIPATLDEARGFRELGDRPLVVLTAGKEQPPAALRSMGVTREQGARLLDASRALHDDQATWSTNARHELVPDATHFIQFDRPDAVIRATREVVQAVRNRTQLR